MSLLANPFFEYSFILENEESIFFHIISSVWKIRSHLECFLSQNCLRSFTAKIPNMMLEINLHKII